MSGRVVIAGGGIAGLVAAIGLARLGFTVSLHEKVSILKEVGAGIQLGPNATRILQKWGVLESLTPHTFAPQFIHLYDGVRGKKLVSLPVGHFVKHHWHAPYLTVHRADLQQILVEIVRNHPQVTFYCDHEVMGITGDWAGGFEVEIAHGPKKIIKQADLFLACDGVWSRQRANFPLQEKADDSGLVAWRATLSSTQLPSNFRALEQWDNVHVFMGRRGHFVAYPLRGGREFNFVAITKNEAGKTHPTSHFVGWASPVRDVLERFPKSVTRFSDKKRSKNKELEQFVEPSETKTALAACQNWTYWPLFTMFPPRFIGARGEIFLGDSAHATTPFAAQGAALAIEDAAALVQALSSPANSWQESLRNFSQKRIKRVLAVKRRGTFNQFVYHAGMPLSLGRNIFMTYRNPANFLKDMDWLYNPPSQA